jgi:hypothetical protein
MPNFDNLFKGSKGHPVPYNGISLQRVDRFPVKNGDVLQLSIKKTNCKYRQGFAIDIQGYCEINGEIRKKGKRVMMIFWEDTMPKQVKLKAFTKEGFVAVKNIWEETGSCLSITPTGENIYRDTQVMISSIRGAAMLVEEIENGRRYRCNDGEPDEDFDDIIFTVQNLGQG